MDELNLSTRDNHQEWVPFENIANALISAVKQDIFTCVSIEQHDQSIFNKKEALKNKKLKRFLSDTNNYSMTSIFESSWIPFHSDTDFSYEATIKETKVEGCDTLFNFLGLHPDNSVKLCCGLTIDYIQEMILNLDNYDQIADIFNNQINDFLKMWIWVDGAEYIYKFVREKNPKIKEYNFIHPCQYCAEIYNNDLIQETLKEHWTEVVDNVTKIL